MPESKRILIAEDDPTVRRTLRELVNRWGFSAAEAVDAPQVREVLRSYQPDILLMDIDGPTIDGMTMLDEIRDRHIQVTTVVITGESEAPKTAKVTTAGAEDCLEKPVEPTVLKSVLTRICERWPSANARINHEKTSERTSQPPAVQGRSLTWPTFEVRVGTKLEEVEHDLITHTIAAVKGNKTRAAAMLGISLRTLYNRLARYRSSHQSKSS